MPRRKEPRIPGTSPGRATIATLRRPLFCKFVLLCPQPDPCPGLSRIVISLSRLHRIITIL
jgi:hypothetical protein